MKLKIKMMMKRNNPDESLEDKLKRLQRPDDLSNSINQHTFIRETEPKEILPRTVNLLRYALMCGLLGLAIYGGYNYALRPLGSTIYENLAPSRRHARYVEIYKEKDPIILDRVFNGKFDAEHNGKKYYLSDISFVVYSPDKSKGAILHETFWNSNNRLFIFNTRGNLNFKELDLRYGNPTNNLFWIDNDTLACEPAGWGLHQIKIDQNNVGYNEEKYEPNR